MGAFNSLCCAENGLPRSQSQPVPSKEASIHKHKSCESEPTKDGTATVFI